MAKGFKTGGRQKGSKNRSTKAAKLFAIERTADIVSSKIDTPLDVMLDNMRFAKQQADEFAAALPKGEKPAADDFKRLMKLRLMAQAFASDAAPYVHPKLASVSHKPEAAPGQAVIAKIEWVITKPGDLGPPVIDGKVIEQSAENVPVEDAIEIEVVSPAAAKPAGTTLQ